MRLVSDPILTGRWKANTSTSTAIRRTSKKWSGRGVRRAEGFADACRRAHEAQRGWAATPAPVRGQVVANMAQLAAANKEALAADITREIGKPYAEALGEVQEVVDTCQFFLGEGRRLYGQTVPSEMPDKQLFTFRVPVGAAVVITAGNFPMAVPVVVPGPGAAVRQHRRLEAGRVRRGVRRRDGAVLRAAGLPDGALLTVHATGADAFDGLDAALSEGLVGKVGFTGSTRSAAGSASCAAATSSRRASSWAARTRSW